MNNSQYKICIFKLKKEYFVSSSLDISTGNDDTWNIFTKSIVFQTNGNFVISLTNPNGTTHSFYANLIKVKKCTCCDSVMLYFKYNIISLETNNLEPSINQDYNMSDLNPYLISCANIESNISYNLKSCEYTNVRFFVSSLYKFNLNL